MTITSLPASTPKASPGKTPGAEATGTPDGTALGFLAELAAAITSVGNLAQVTGALPGTVPSASGTKSGSGTPAVASLATPVATGATVLGALPGIAGLAGNAALSGPTAPTTTTQTATGPAPATATAPAIGMLAARAATVPATPQAVVATAAATTGPAATTPTTGPADATAPSTAAPGTPPAAVVAAATADGQAGTAAGGSHEHRAAHTGAPSPAAPATPAPSADQLGATAVAATQATATAGPATADKARTTAVLQQVFPEITKMATAGNGTHRMTLTLHPDDLGTVRVTLTVRDGSVRVSLAADQATSALAAGRPELQSLLEQHGATDTRIVVRDLGTATQDPSTQSGEGRQPGQQQGQQTAYTSGGYADDAPRGRPDRPTPVVPEPRRAAAATSPTASPSAPAPSGTRVVSGLDRLI